MPEVTLPAIECPECHTSFRPPLPEPPELPEEVTEAAEDEGFTRGTPMFAQIMLVQGMLASQRDSFRRKFGFNTDLAIDRANLTWTFTVSVPKSDMPADDAIVDAEIVDDEPGVVHVVNGAGKVIRSDRIAPPDDDRSVK